MRELLFRDYLLWRRQERLMRQVRQGKLTISQARARLGLPPWQLDLAGQEGENDGSETDCAD